MKGFVMKIRELITESKFGLASVIGGSLKWIITAVSTMWWLSLIVEPFTEYYKNMQIAENSLNSKEMNQKEFDEYHIKQLSGLIGKVAAQTITRKVTKFGLRRLSEIPIIGRVASKIPSTAAQSYFMSKLDTPEASQYIAIAMMQPVFQQFVKNVGIPVEKFIKDNELKAEEFFNSLIGLSNEKLGTNIPQIDTTKPLVNVDPRTGGGAPQSNLAPNGLPWADPSEIFGGGFDPRRKK
jgi:hypothetical protein